MQILVLAIFFQQSINDAGLQVMGLVLAIIGLTMFLDGLRVSVMVSEACMFIAEMRFYMVGGVGSSKTFFFHGTACKLLVDN